MKDIKKMSLETGILVLEIKRALKIKIDPKKDVVNTDKAIELIVKFKNDHHFSREVIKQWKRIAIIEVETEEDFFLLNRLWKKLPTKFKASRLAHKKLNQMLVISCEKTNDISELRSILSLSPENWSAHKIVANKLDAIFEELVSKAQSICEIKEVDFKFFNYSGNRDSLLLKWDEFTFQELIKAKTLNDFIAVYNNSFPGSESRSFALLDLENLALKEIQKPKNSAAMLIEVLDKLPKYSNLQNIFTEKITTLVVEDIKRSITFSELKEIKTNYWGYFKATKKLEVKTEQLAEYFLQNFIFQEDLIEVWSFFKK